MDQKSSIPNSPEPLPLKDVMDYAMKHFLFVADQRLKTFNFYILVLVGSVGLTLNAEPKGGAFKVIGFLHLCIAFFFFLIEVRNRRLLRITRDHVQKIEQHPDWFQGCTPSVDESKCRGMGFFSFTVAIFGLIGVEFVFGLLVIICAFWINHDPRSLDEKTETPRTQSDKEHTILKIQYSKDRD
jgi:hypothetical protein